MDKIKSVTIRSGGSKQLFTVDYMPGGKNEASLSRFNARRANRFSRRVRVWRNLRAASAIALGLMAVPWWVFSKAKRQDRAYAVEAAIVSQYYPNIYAEEYFSDHGRPDPKLKLWAEIWIIMHLDVVMKMVAHEQVNYSTTERKIDVKPTRR